MSIEHSLGSAWVSLSLFSLCCMCLHSVLFPLLLLLLANWPVFHNDLVCRLAQPPGRNRFPVNPCMSQAQKEITSWLPDYLHLSVLCSTAKTLHQDMAVCFQSLYVNFCYHQITICFHLTVETKKSGCLWFPCLCPQCSSVFAAGGVCPLQTCWHIFFFV